MPSRKEIVCNPENPVKLTSQGYASTASTSKPKALLRVGLSTRAGRRAWYFDSPGSHPPHRVYQADFGNQLLYAGGSLAVALCAGILIVSLVVTENGARTRFFTNPAMLWLGRRSYGLYVWHWPIFYLCAYIKRPAVAIPVAVCAALAAAAVSYRFIELPFLRMKARFLARCPT